MTLPARLGDRTSRLSRWDPFREMEDVWTQMGSLLGEAMSNREGLSARLIGGLTAPVDIEETSDAFIVELDLPGVRRDDVSIDLRDCELVVTGEIKEREQRVMHRRHRAAGRFGHRIVVPGEVDPEAVSASLADGVLTVRLAKTEPSHARHIEIRPEPGEDHG